MARLRHHAQNFIELNTGVIIVGPEAAPLFKAYWSKLGLDQKGLAFIGVPDPGHEVLDLYAQPRRLLRLGRMPAQMLVDINGVLRWSYYGSSMLDIPHVSEVLERCGRLSG